MQPCKGSFTEGWHWIGACATDCAANEIINKTSHHQFVGTARGPGGPSLLRKTLAGFCSFGLFFVVVGRSVNIWLSFKCFELYACKLVCRAFLQKSEIILSSVHPLFELHFSDVLASLYAPVFLHYALVRLPAETWAQPFYRRASSIAYYLISPFSTFIQDFSASSYFSSGSNWKLNSSYFSLFLNFIYSSFKTHEYCYFHFHSISDFNPKP